MSLHHQRRRVTSSMPSRVPEQCQSPAEQMRRLTVCRCTGPLVALPTKRVRAAAASGIGGSPDALGDLWNPSAAPGPDPKRPRLERRPHRKIARVEG